MLKLKGDSLAVLEYHTSGDFTNSDASGRTSYYGIASVPTAKIDGKRTCSGGGTGTFSCYLGAYNWEMLFTPSQCTIRLDVMYDPVTRLLEVQTWTTALDALQNPRLRYAIAESHIFYEWQGLDSLQHVVRKMLPNYQGVFCNAGVGETFYDFQSYTLPSTWVDANCEVVVFVQTDYSPFTVLRVAKAGLFPSYVFGDANDDGIVDVGDAVFLISYLYKGGDAPNPYGRGDVNRDCRIEVGDIVYTLNYLYRGGDAPLKGCD
ncbi:MAG: dockerin type I domain-containing protein [Candidatus Zixiibacteriota bacterium]